MSKSVIGVRHWHDSNTPQRLAETAPPQQQTVWARSPWQGKFGRYVAIRFAGESVEVGIAGSPRVKWVTASTAMTGTELERWIRTGFEARP